MTTPTLKPAMPAGGILTQHVDTDFADFIAGRPVTQRVCIGIVQVGGVASSNQEKGRVNRTKYEVVRWVEITDDHEADRLRRLILQEQANRGLLATQPALFDTTEAEQRESLIDLIRDWASENDTPIADVDARWLDYFGGPEHAASATVQAGSLQQLKEFALVVGAIADPTPDESSSVAAPAFVEPTDADDDTDPDDDADDDDPDAA